MNPEESESRSPKRPPVRALTWAALGLAVIVLAAVLIPRPAQYQATPSQGPSARMANAQQAAEMEAQISKSSSHQKPPLDAQRFLALVREASMQYGHDNMGSVNAGKEAIQLLDASRDAQHGALYRAEIALVVARSAKASGDRGDQTAYAAIGEQSFNDVLSDPHATPAQKKQAKDDLAHLKELSQ